ncbi:MAG: hypothetical protein ACEQSX_14935 [Baekduiaceae bacterium]
MYGTSAGDRRVRARLFHDPAPPPGAPARPFAFRAADLDVADHVNNAAYWTALEELLAGADAPAVPYDAEIEHRVPGDAGPAAITGDAAAAWILDPAGTTLATIRELHA